MSKKMKRILLDAMIYFVCFLSIEFAGAGLWALLILPYGLWCYYDGMTRRYLTG